MAVTSHGHYIPDSPIGTEDTRRAEVARCGGIHLCGACSTQVKIYQMRINEERRTSKASHDEVMIHLVADALAAKSALKKDTILDLLENGWAWKEQPGKPDIWVQKAHWYSY